MAKLWPLPSSTVVSARLVASAGITRPPMLIAPLSERSLTSGRTLRLIRLALSTVGVNARLMPNSLNSISRPLSPLSIGIGNSPPARKLAVSPESAVRLGSARTLTRPSSARASMALLRMSSPEVYLPNALLVAVGARRKLPSPSVTGRPLTKPKVKLPVLKMASQLIPNSLSTSREISATRTRRWTWVGAATRTRWSRVSSSPT